MSCTVRNEDIAEFAKAHVYFTMYMSPSPKANYVIIDLIKN
jgi:hypothetical protein